MIVGVAERADINAKNAELRRDLTIRTNDKSTDSILDVVSPWAGITSLCWDIKVGAGDW